MSGPLAQIANLLLDAVHPGNQVGPVTVHPGNQPRLDMIDPGAQSGLDAVHPDTEATLPADDEILRLLFASEPLSG